jgi:hypothetical protein
MRFENAVNVWSAAANFFERTLGSKRTDARR